MGVNNRLICLIEPDIRTREDLVEQIGHYGYAVLGFASTEEVRAKAPSAPAVIVASLDNNDGDMHISDLQESLQPQPALVFTASADNVQLRLRAVRFGALGYFKKPVNIDALIGLLDEVTAPSIQANYRVMIVESDPQVAAELALVLEGAGMHVKIVTDSLQLLVAADGFAPELILLDLYYPEILGMELATVLRQDPAYERVPIVFQSNEMDPARRIQALQRGGDDCLLRPIHPEYLARVISSRIARARTIQSLLHRDGLTGLLSHRAVLEALEMKMALADAQGKELPFVMVDIDRFKKINDTHGHPVGDLVLKSLGRLLKQRVWNSDLVGRLGGEEFGIVVTSMDSATAARVFNEIRVDFAQIRHNSPQGDFYATFSCGIAPYPRYATSAAMEDAAERAVRHVKSLGGNRVGLMR